MLNGLVERQNNRLTRTTRELRAFVSRSPAILLDKEFAGLAKNLFVVYLFNSCQAVSIKAHEAEYARGHRAIWVKALLFLPDVNRRQLHSLNQERLFRTKPASCPDETATTLSRFNNPRNKALLIRTQKG